MCWQRTMKEEKKHCITYFEVDKTKEQ